MPSQLIPNGLSYKNHFTDARTDTVVRTPIRLDCILVDGIDKRISHTFLRFSHFDPAKFARSCSLQIDSHVETSKISRC
ncbi:MAG: hypothetical protein ACRCUY_09115 [Thermoguttaceae bacterium]